MQEHVHNWLTDKTKVPGVLACGIRSPDRKTFTRSQSTQFTAMAVENACRCVSDTFQVIKSNRFPTDSVRWVYENYFVVGVIRPDGHCLTLVTRRNALPNLKPADLDRITAEFNQLET